MTSVLFVSFLSLSLSLLLPPVWCLGWTSPLLLMYLRVLMVNNPQAPFDFRLVCFLSLSLFLSVLFVLFDFLLLSLLFHLLVFFSFHSSYSLVLFTIVSFLCLSYCLFLFLSSFFECTFIFVSYIPSLFVFFLSLSYWFLSVCSTLCTQTWELQLPCSLHIRTQLSDNINELRKGEPVMVQACFCSFFSSLIVP